MTAKKNGNDGRTRLKVKRVVFRVQATKDRAFPWKLTGNGSVDHYKSKSNAIANGALLCGYMYRDQGIRTQLVIHGKDGRIQSERTYGADPVRRKG